MGARHERIDFVRLVEEAQDLDALEAAFAEAVGAGPVGAAAVIDFLEIPGGASFDLTPEQAVAYFQAKGLKPTFSYADMLDHQHDVSFTVAKMMDVDMLGQVRASLDSALAGGQTFKQWADQITPILQSGGWWGRKAVTDPLTGKEVVGQLGRPWRLETIFRTNMQTAYAAGAWQEIKAQEEEAPFLMYDAVDDFRTRPLHASWDRKVLPVSSHWWSSHYPPNGYNCRCGVIQLSGDEVEAMGLKVARQEPDDGTFEWTNPRTGDVHQVERGIDPGFEHNAGKSWSAKLKQLLAEKIDALPPSMAEAAKKAAAEAQAKAAIDAAKVAAAEAQQAAAVAAAQAALERAKALAAEKAKQWAAQQQLDLIAKGGKDIGTHAQFKVKALADLKKGAGWATLRPAEQLQAVNDLAAELKQQKDVINGLYSYKQAVLKGKTPPPAAVKAFKTLPQDQADAFIAKLDAEVQAIEAAKAAEAAAIAQKAAEEAAAAAGQAEPPAQSLALLDGTPPDPASMTVVGRKAKGGTEGAFYQDTATGQKWLVKFNGSEDAVRNEVLASKLYALAGVEAPELHAIQLGGRWALASKVVDGIAEVGAKVLAGTPSVIDGFAVDAWLANWDVVGLSFDNVVLVGGRAMRIDVGGALRYRAVGGLKGSAFGSKVGEIESLRGPTAAQARQVFGTMTAQQIEASVERVLAISDADIRAVVARYGPPDQATRDELADLMVARKRDLEQRFPAAAQRVRERQAAQGGEPPEPARVTAAEQEAVEASRVNGYGFATDSDQIEDNMVIVHTLKRADGADATRGFMKLTPEASRALRDRIGATAGDAAPSVNMASARDAVLSAVKSINFRADKGEKFDAKVVQKVKAAISEVDKALAGIGSMKTAAVKPEALAMVESEFKSWRDALAASLPEIEKFGPAKKVSKMFPAAAIPDALEFLAVKSAGAAPGPKWRRVAGSYKYETASFDRSFARLNGGTGEVYGAMLRFEATLDDGTIVTYHPHDADVAWAMQGVLQVDITGRGAARTSRVFGAMDEIGLKSVRAGEVDRQHLYLNAYARIALLRGRGAAFKAEFAAIKDRTADGVAAKLALLKRATGVDVSASEGWRQFDGVRQAFGHGRAYQLRPDLSDADMRALDRTHVLYHNPKGLALDAKSGVFERIKPVIEGGGVFASLTDRVRRGVPLSGSSVGSDLESGGGDYHFTRVRTRRSQAGRSGVYWKADALRRMDAITYENDQFGRTTGTTIDDTRLGQSVDDFRSVAGSSRNETIFKAGLSIFDSLDRIVLSSKAEVDEAISWLRAKGYRTWPDGRELAEIIVTSEAHRAKP